MIRGGIEQFFQSGERVSPNQPKLLFERADTCIRARRNLDAVASAEAAQAKTDLVWRRIHRLSTFVLTWYLHLPGILA